MGGVDLSVKNMARALGNRSKEKGIWFPHIDPKAPLIPRCTPCREPKDYDELSLFFWTFGSYSRICLDCQAELMVLYFSQGAPRWTQ